MGYNVRLGDQEFPNLSPKEALLKVRELVALGADPYLYDPFGDPMGLAELERVAGREFRDKT